MASTFGTFPSFLAQRGCCPILGLGSSAIIHEAEVGAILLAHTQLARSDKDFFLSPSDSRAIQEALCISWRVQGPSNSATRTWLPSDVLDLPPSDTIVLTGSISYLSGFLPEEETR